MQQCAVTAHGETCDVALAGVGRNREVVLHKFRQFLVKKIIEILSIGSILIGLVMAGEGDNGNTVLLGVSLNAGVAQPGLIIVAVAVEQIQHRELVRQSMAVGIAHIAGSK